MELLTSIFLCIYYFVHVDLKNMPIGVAFDIHYQTIELVRALPVILYMNTCCDKTVDHAINGLSFFFCF